MLTHMLTTTVITAKMTGELVDTKIIQILFIASIKKLNDCTEITNASPSLYASTLSKLKRSQSYYLPHRVLGKLFRFTVLLLQDTA